MGAFGSCLGVGRPVKPGANPRLLASNPVGVPFGHPSTPCRPGSHMMRPSSTGIRGPNKNPTPKLVRQTSGLTAANQQQAQTSSFSQRQNMVQPLVEIDDNILSSPLDRANQNSHLVCNRKQPASSTSDAGINGPVDATNVELLFMEAIRRNPNETRELVALFDYTTGPSQDDLPFYKGEHLETTLKLMSTDWWLARSKTTKRIGYIPSNYVAEPKSIGAEAWYFGKIGRQEAERLLRLPANGHGAFIIRDSDTIRDNEISRAKDGGKENEISGKQYSLSVRDKDVVKHYRVKQLKTGGFCINTKTVFSTIHDLVLHYKEAADGLCVNLREPCVRGLEKPSTNGLSHDTCDKWEMDRRHFTLGQELGHGQFGQVFEGLFQGKTRVAIKTLKGGTMDPADFLAEAQIMKKLRHKNLVELYAVCTKEEPVFIITELMSKGALVSYLQTEEGRNLPLPQYINMATQIASGMKFLEQEKYVHRDLAARNILVGENNICKIADFGLARFIKENEYEAKVGARFPIKWTAPEAANYSKFTIKSDVWSFGIVLYEIITKGATPYPDMSNADVLSRIEHGYRMPQPPDCQPKYYKLMLDCWRQNPEQRPTFETLHMDLENYFSSDTEQYKEASHFRER